MSLHELVCRILPSLADPLNWIKALQVEIVVLKLVFARSQDFGGGLRHRMAKAFHRWVRNNGERTPGHA